MTPTAFDTGGESRHHEYGYDERGGLQNIVDPLHGNVTVASFVTDVTGRLESESRPGLTRQYGWDVDGRLTSVRKTADSLQLDSVLQYDFAGMRRAKRTESYPAGQVKVVSGEGTNVTVTNGAWLWGAGELVEERLEQTQNLYENMPGGMAIAAGGERLAHDSLGSVVARLGVASPSLTRWTPGAMR